VTLAHGGVEIHAREIRHHEIGQDRVEALIRAENVDCRPRAGHRDDVVRVAEQHSQRHEHRWLVVHD
jgi:hypothetical protein